jgi:nitroreductase
MNSALLDYLRERRSTPLLESPGPTSAQIAQLINCATQVPDHRRLAPWRVIAVAEDERLQLGTLWARHLARSEAETQTLLRNAQRAPVILVCICSPVDEPKVPRDEQLITAGLATYTLLMAANALGYGGYWRTGQAAGHTELNRELGLQANETVVGYLYLGTPASRAVRKPRPVKTSLPVSFGLAAQSECEQSG